MTQAEICESDLGHRIGYVKGLGFGPKLTSAFKSRQTSSYPKIELEKKLFETQILMEAQQKKLDTQHKRIEYFEVILEQIDQQHQQQFEEITCHLRLSQGFS